MHHYKRIYTSSLRKSIYIIIYILYQYEKGSFKIYKYLQTIFYTKRLKSGWIKYIKLYKEIFEVNVMSSPAFYSDSWETSAILLLTFS